MRVLAIVETAYRATLEQQDDSVLWLMGALANAGAPISVLLRGNAVNYLNKRQRVEVLRSGEARLGNPPKLVEDVAALMRKNVAIYFVDEDAGERGLERGDLVTGAMPVSRSGLAKWLAGYDRVFHF